jgi:SNF2 family DNA or RNA helicase
VQVISGSAAQRRKQFDTPADVYVINWESLRSHSRLAPYGSVALARCPQCGGHDEKVTETRCEVHIRELNKIDFHSVVADEIHRSKEPKSKQSRALWAATGDADVRFALTGTPIANNVLDLWAILHWLSPEEWPSKTRWIDRTVDTMLNAFGGMMVLGVKPTMQGEFDATINPRLRRMLKKVVLPWLPDMLFERRDVEMSTKQAKAYKQMRDLMIAELEGGEALTAPSALTQTTRLLQFASAYAEVTLDPVTGEQKVKLADPSCKVDALMNDIKSGDFGDDSVAVCAVSRQLIEILSAELTKNKIEHGLITGAQSEDERQQAVDDFQSGKTKWVLFTAQAGGVGITLTAARRLVMLQRPWSLVDHKQALDRVHRIGSEIHDSIVVTDYVTEGTIEERVIQVLETKADNFEQIVRDRDQLIALLKDDKAGKL